jgi:ferredoxin-NADP reductase
MSSIVSQTDQLKLQDRYYVAESTMAFQFEKPEGFVFKAGQFLDMTLIDPSETDAEGNQRAFSIASAPDEPTLLVVTRMRDTAFKRVLATMPTGTNVDVEGPFGNLVLHDDQERAAVFLAGGIGITPFRSILLQATKERAKHRLFCFYANRRPQDAPFLEELQVLQRQFFITIVPTMTRLSGSDRSWEGETGRIDRFMLERHLRCAASPIFYIAGPPGMVKGTQKMLREAGVANGDIRSEEFAGY